MNESWFRRWNILHIRKEEWKMATIIQWHLDLNDVLSEKLYKCYSYELRKRSSEIKQQFLRVLAIVSFSHIHESSMLLVHMINVFRIFNLLWIYHILKVRVSSRRQYLSMYYSIFHVCLINIIINCSNKKMYKLIKTTKALSRQS